MKTDIYYFSGSGNSLAIAKNISEKSENAQIISIPQFIQKANEVRGDVIGIVCPIYFNNMPHIVADFIKMITEANYIFMVYAGAGELGAGFNITQKLFASQKLKLSALFNITMPDNSTRYGEITEEKQKELFENAGKRVDRIIEVVKGKARYFDRNTTGSFKTYIHPGILHRFLYKGMNKMDKDFSVNNNCTGCGTCQKVCPVKNISIVDNKPEWKQNGKCQVCCACHDWCPKEAILHSSTTAGVKRYHNPNIQLNEIIKSSCV